MADIHRKIELQEPDDLRFLIGNARRAADTKIDLALPPIEGEDALRKRVEELVHDYITQTFSLAAPNLAINGHEIPSDSPIITQRVPPNPSDEPETITEFDPFSDKLRDKAARLLQQEEALLLEVGRLRREAPAKAAEMRREALQKEIEDVLRDINDGGDEGGDVELGVEKLERMEDVEASYKRGVQGLVRLKTELPATAARMEQAKRAGEYVLGEK